MSSFKMFGSAKFSVLGFVFVAMVVGCVKPGQRGADPNNGISGELEEQPSTFFHETVVSATGKNAVVSKNLPDFSIATEKLFTFKTCVKDKRLQETVKGHPFIVRGTVTGDIKVNSDESGCVIWSERIEYNAIADAVFLPLRRLLIGNGMHTGSRILNIAINPWARNGEEDIRDLSKQPLPEEQLAVPADVPEILKGLKKHSKSVATVADLNAGSLWIDDMRINLTHRPGGDDGAILDFNFSNGPKVNLRNVRGDTDPVLLSDGKFEGEFWIISRDEFNADKKGACHIFGRTGKINDITMVGGRLRSDVKLRMRYTLSYGQLELVGRLAVRGAEAGGAVVNLAPFEGVWMIGDQSQLLGMKFAEMRKPTYDNSQKKFVAKDYLEGCRDVSGPLDSKQKSQIPVDRDGMATVPGIPGFTSSSKVPADLMEDAAPSAEDLPRLFPNDPALKNFQAGNDLLTNARRKLPSGVLKIEQFEFQNARFNDGVAPEPIVEPGRSETTTQRTIKYQVKIRVTNPLAGGTIVRGVKFMISKSDGSDPFPVTTDHEGNLIFSDSITHKYFEQERFVLKVVRITHSSGFTKRLALVFNPWDNNSFTFARDLRLASKQTIAQVNLVPRPESKLLLTNYNWGTQSFRYEVDNFLNLSMFKEFYLTIAPRVLRYSSLTEGRMKNEVLRDGIYLLKVAIQRKYRPIGGTDTEFVTAVQKLVRVEAGMIITPLEMGFRDLRVLRIRSNLMIEIAAVDESKLTDEDRRTMRPKVPLNEIEAKDSGLKARTFIGPVVAFSNGFSSAMRPLDDLQEEYCPSVDCSELAKGTVPTKAESEKALLFGDIRALKGLSVTKLIERQAQLEKQYQDRMTEKVRLSNFLNAANLEYASVKSDSAQLKKDPALAKNNQIIPNANGYADFLQKMQQVNGSGSFTPKASALFNTRLSRAPFDAAKLSRVLFEDRDKLDPELATRVCAYFMHNVVMRAKTPEELQAAKTLSSYCLRDALTANARPDDFGSVTVERKMLVSKVSRSERLGGNLLFLNVSAGSSVGRGHSESFSYGLSVHGAISDTLKWASSVIPGLQFGQKFLDASGLTMGWSSSRSKSFGEDTSTGTGTNIAVELRGMRFRVDEGERCAILRLNPEFISKYQKEIKNAIPVQSLDLTPFKNLKLPSAHRRQSEYEIANEKHYLKEAVVETARLSRATRGVMFCEGTKSKPVFADERYYQLSQAIGDELMNDPSAPENHPFILSIRSRTDYGRFVADIEARPRGLGTLPDAFAIGELPMLRLQKAFRAATPAYPGILTIEDESITEAPVEGK